MTRWGLWAGVAALALYYGVQLAAAPAHPGYDFTRNVASELGAPESGAAGLFNAGVLIVGALLLVNGVAQLARLRATGTHGVLAGVAAIAAASFGVATVFAGLFPLPDPRHAMGAPLLMAAMLYSPAMLAALWRRPVWRWVFVGCVLALGAAAMVMSGVFEIDRGRWAGLIQRPTALALLGPIALGSIALLRTMRRAP